MATQNDKIEKYLREIADHGGVKWAIMRGFFTGVFTAIGLIFGTAIIIFIGSNFLTDLRQVPLINDFLRETKLDVLIEKEVNKITETNDVSKTDTVNQNVTNTNNSSGDEASSYAKFSNQVLGLEFFYPSNLSELSIEEDASEVILKGNGELKEIKIYKDRNIEITTKNTIKQPASNVEFGQLEINIFSDGLEINNRNIPNPAYVVTITTEKSTYTVLGIADENSSSIGREVFIKILESFKTVSAD